MLRERYENGAELPKSGVADREVVEADGTALRTANIWHKPTWQLGTKHSLGPWINIKASGHRQSVIYVSARPRARKQPSI
jgi:hypothetical protein